MKCPRKYTVSENMRFERFRYVLTPADVGNLKSYKYECDGKGFVEKLVDAVSFFVYLTFSSKDEYFFLNICTLL